MNRRMCVCVCLRARARRALHAGRGLPPPCAVEACAASAISGEGGFHRPAPQRRPGRAGGGGRGGVGGCVKERGFRQNQTLLAIRFDTTAEGYARWVLQDGPPGWRTASQPRTPTHTTKPNQRRVLPAQGARESLGARCSRIPPQRSRRSQAPLSDSDCAGRNAATGSGP